MAKKKSILSTGPHAIEGFEFFEPGMHVEVSVKGRFEDGSQAWPTVVSVGEKTHRVRFSKADQKRFGIPAETTINARQVFDHDPLPGSPFSRTGGMKTSTKLALGAVIVLGVGLLLAK